LLIQLHNLILTRNPILYNLYDISTKGQAYDLLSKLKVNFSAGLRSGAECTVQNLKEQCVYSNKEVQNAHHDFICHALPESCGNQCKITLAPPKGGQINLQLDCKYLLWWYPNFREDQPQYPVDFRVPTVKKKLDCKELGFLRGSGCATGLAIDMIKFLKQCNQKNKKKIEKDMNNDESENSEEIDNEEESVNDPKLTIEHVNKKRKRKRLQSAPLPKKKKNFEGRRDETDVRIEDE